MAFIKPKTLLLLAGPLLVAALAFGGFVWSGVYDVGADVAHAGPVHATLETLRERSVAVRAGKLEVPDLNDPARVMQGAGNYAAMCAQCHLAPGMAATELSLGLYPAPPDLGREMVDAAQAFWIIKHGIKASGMPAWGKSMGDAYIWNMVAFLQRLPAMDAEQYQTLVASSGGHSHGGGETPSQPHPDPSSDAAGQPPGTSVNRNDAPSMAVHRHADGTMESHPVAPAKPADDGHDHQH